MADGIYRCGSGPESEFPLEFSGAETTLCTFILKAGTFSVNRIDGRVWVNDLPVNGINRLTDGDVISLGPVSYRLEFLDAPSHLPESDVRPWMFSESAVPQAGHTPPEQDSSVQAALQKELEEHQPRPTLRQQQLAKLADIAQERESLLHARETGFQQLCDDYAAREASCSLREMELRTKAETLTLQEAALAAREQALTEAVQKSADAEQTRNVEQLAEITAARQQLAESALALSAADDDRASMLAERESLLSAMRALQETLQDARLERSELNTKLAAYAESAADAAGIIRPGVDSAGAQSFDYQSRELDMRAQLLDRREEELRERTRKIEQTEGDIDFQRRQLLEARQQMELARAEIQMAMRTHTESELHVASPLRGEPLRSSIAGKLSSDRRDSDSQLNHSELYDPAHVPGTDLLSELAAMFGLQVSAADSVTPPRLPPAEFVDVSEPSGKNQSVAFHFGPEPILHAATASTLAVADDPEPVREENSDEFVRNYMEQLLSRSRNSGGTALPGELKAAERKKNPVAAYAAKTATEPAPKSAPKVTSFIEQYMAGNMTLGEPLLISPPERELKAVASTEAGLTVPPRPKTDLLKLRQEMDAFRTLSTQSMEHALASHAIKAERQAFTGRTVFAALLITMAVILAIAKACGAIDQPFLIWVTLTSAIAILAELYRQYLAIAVHSRNPLDLLFEPDKGKGYLQKSRNKPASRTPLPDSGVDSEIGLRRPICSLRSPGL